MPASWARPTLPAAIAADARRLSASERWTEPSDHLSSAAAKSRAGLLFQLARYPVGGLICCGCLAALSQPVGSYALPAQRGMSVSVPAARTGRRPDEK